MNQVCRAHPRYTGKRRPMVPCPGCFWVWIVREGHLFDAYEYIRKDYTPRGTK